MDNQLRSALPTQFGKHNGIDSFNIDDAYKNFERHVPDEQDSSDSDSDQDDILPTSHELTINAHIKQISSISADSSGSRLVTGSYDESLSLWDFSGMDSTDCSPFKSVEPLESHQLHQAVFSSSQAGNNILVIPCNARPKLYSRDAKELCQYAAGDMYLMDMRNTKGHVGDISQGSWNHNSSDFATIGADSTVRIWDSTKSSSQKMVIVLRNALKGEGARTHGSAVEWLTPTSVISASTDGALRLFDTRHQVIRPSKEVTDGHKAKTFTSSLAVLNEHTFGSRGGAGDETVKLWDIRQFKKPLLSRSGFQSTSEEMSLSLSPEGPDRYLVTASGNSLEIMDLSDLTSVQAIEYSSNVTQVYWHHKLNQIFVGLSDGQLNILFSKDVSQKGAKLVVERAPKVHHIDEAMTANISLQGLNQEIMDRENKVAAVNEQKRIERERVKRGLNEPSILPVKPNPGIWGVPDPKHLEENVPLSERKAEDSREKLLEYAERASQDPRFKSFHAQPKIYAEEPSDQSTKRQKTS